MHTESIDFLVRDLYAELRALDLPVPSRLTYPSVLEEIDRAIWPARLPSSVRRLWELIDPDRLVVSSYPELSTPEFGLEAWHMNREDDVIPRHLFQFCYSSHDVLSVECDGLDWTGGALFEWFLSDNSPFQLRYRGAEDWLVALISALRQGAFERDGGSVTLDMDQIAEIAARLTREDPHPDYGSRAEFARETSDWPEVWSKRSGTVS